MLVVVPTASAAQGPGALNCAPLPAYNNTHWAVTVGTTVHCTIDGATDVSTSTVDVIIKSSTLGNTTVTGTVNLATHQISFSWAVPASRCDTNIVAYKTSGNNTNNSLIPPGGGSSSAGFGYVDAQGNPATCGGTPTAVKMLSFAARSTAKNVHLSWKTASEAGTLGYNVYRQTAAGKVKLNSKLILAKSPAGAAYSFVARKASGTYLLQEVRSNGASRWLARTRIAS